MSQTRKFLLDYAHSPAKGCFGILLVVAGALLEGLGLLMMGRS